MSDDKDPVREQIERDSERLVISLRGVDRNHKQWIKEAHVIGATIQDKIAWNRCLDAVKADAEGTIKLCDCDVARMSGMTQMCFVCPGKEEYFIVKKETIENLRR